MSKVWLVTGATRGLGADIAKAALSAGNQVVATGRKAEAVTKALGNSENLLAVALDVTKESQINAAVRAAVARFGRIDVLVNNAGYGQMGVFEETSLQQIRDQFDTNVFGLMAVTHAVLPVMRKQRAGRIFNISSVAGFRSVFGASIYSSTKFAVEGLSRGLAEEVAEFGVYVTLIEPGFFRTEFLESDSLKYSEGSAIPEYAKRLAEFRAFHEKRNRTQLGDPAKLARILLQLAEAEKPPLSFLAGSDAVQWVREILKAHEAQVNANHDLSVSTDIPGIAW